MGEITLNNEELLLKMKEVNDKYKSMKKLAMKVATEMDSLLEQYAPLLEEAKNRNLV